MANYGRGHEPDEDIIPIDDGDIKWLTGEPLLNILARNFGDVPSTIERILPYLNSGTNYSEEIVLSTLALMARAKNEIVQRELTAQIPKIVPQLLPIFMRKMYFDGWWPEKSRIQALMVAFADRDPAFFETQPIIVEPDRLPNKDLVTLVDMKSKGILILVGGRTYVASVVNHNLGESFVPFLNTAILMLDRAIDKNSRHPELFTTARPKLEAVCGYYLGDKVELTRMSQTILAKHGIAATRTRAAKAAHRKALAPE